ncbi:MAG: hypothetical protein ACJ8R9_23250 [Steroidobacteraceae bacterium]
MKVGADSSGLSALDTWLRDAGVPERAQEQVAVASPFAMSAAIQQPRDTAEDLLVLNVWSGCAPDPLRTVDFPAGPDADATVQHWAEHIFTPLC